MAIRQTRAGAEKRAACDFARLHGPSTSLARPSRDARFCGSGRRATPDPHQRTEKGPRPLSPHSSLWVSLAARRSGPLGPSSCVPVHRTAGFRPPPSSSAVEIAGSGSSDIVGAPGFARPSPDDRDGCYRGRRALSACGARVTRLLPRLAAAAQLGAGRGSC